MFVTEKTLYFLYSIRLTWHILKWDVWLYLWMQLKDFVWLFRLIKLAFSVLLLLLIFFVDRHRPQCVVCHFSDSLSKRTVVGRHTCFSSKFFSRCCSQKRIDFLLIGRHLGLVLQSILPTSDHFWLVVWDAHWRIQITQRSVKVVHVGVTNISNNGDTTTVFQRALAMHFICRSRSCLRWWACSS